MLGQGCFFPRRFWSAVRRPPVRRSALRVVRTLDSALVSGSRRSLLRRSFPERRSLPFGSPGLPIGCRNSDLSVLRVTPRLAAPAQHAVASKEGSDYCKHLQIRERDRNSSPAASLPIPLSLRLRSRRRPRSLRPEILVRRPGRADQPAGLQLRNPPFWRLRQPDSR